MTAAKAAPELIPNTATATAMANSKLLLAAVVVQALLTTGKAEKQITNTGYGWKRKESIT